MGTDDTAGPRDHGNEEADADARGANDHQAGPDASLRRDDVESGHGPNRRIDGDRNRALADARDLVLGRRVDLRTARQSACHSPSLGRRSSNTPRTLERMRMVAVATSGAAVAGSSARADGARRVMISASGRAERRIMNMGVNVTESPRPCP